jgi:hypothetical protein
VDEAQVLESQSCRHQEGNQIMMWFLIAYTAAGLSVAVSPPWDKEGCVGAQLSEEIYFKDLPEKDYAFVCEQHKKRPKLTGKVDHHEQKKLNWPCYNTGKACGMLEEDKEHGLPLGTTSTRFWKERELKK